MPLKHESTKLNKTLITNNYYFDFFVPAWRQTGFCACLRLTGFSGENCVFRLDSIINNNLINILSNTYGRKEKEISK